MKAAALQPIYKCKIFIKVSTSISVRNMNTVTTHTNKEGRCSLTNSTIKRELRSPVLSKRRPCQRQSVNTSRKSLPKNGPKKCNEREAVKHAAINTHDRITFEKQVPLESTQKDNRTETSINNKGCSGERKTEDCLSTTAEECGNLIKQSTNVEECCNSKNLKITNNLPSYPSVDETGSTQTTKVSATSKALSGSSRFFPVSVTDTAIIVHKRQCVSCCPNTRHHIEDITKNVDYNTAENIHPQPNGNHLSDSENVVAHEDPYNGDFIFESEKNTPALKHLETSSLVASENQSSYNLSVDIETTARTSPHCHSSTGTSTTRRKSLPVSRVGDSSLPRSNTFLLPETIAPSNTCATFSKGQPLRPSSSDALQPPNSPADNTTQNSSLHSSSKEQDQNPTTWSLLDDLLAKLIPQHSPVDSDAYFDQMVDLVLQILYNMYIKHSKNKCKETTKEEGNGNEPLEKPDIETMKRNYKQKPKDTVGSSLLVKRWNPKQCTQDSEPLLQVKYNAPLRPVSRPASRSNKCELRARSDSPRRLEQSELRKSLNYVRKKVIVHLSEDAFSPEKAEKAKKRPNVTSKSPRKLSSMAQGDHKVSTEIKMIPNLQTHSLTTKKVPVYMGTNQSARSKTDITPTVRRDNVTVRKINVRSLSKRDIHTIKRGDVSDKEDYNAKKHNVDDRLANKAQSKRCWTSLGDPVLKSPAGVSGFRTNSQSRNMTKINSISLCHSFVDCNECSNGKLTTSQQVSPKRSSARANLLFGGLNNVVRDETSYVVFPSKQTHGLVEVGSVSIQERPTVNNIAGECVSAEEDLVSSDQLSHRRSHFHIEKNTADEQRINTINYPRCYDVREKRAMKRNRLKGKQIHQSGCDEINKLLTNDLGMRPQSRPGDGRFCVENSRNRQELESHHFCYCEQTSSEEFDRQGKSRKFTKYKGHRMEHNGTDSGHRQLSKSQIVPDLPDNKSIPNRPKYWQMSSTGLESCNVKSISDLVTNDLSVTTTDFSNIDSNELTLAERSSTKENNDTIDTKSDSFQNAANTPYFTLQPNPEITNKTFNRQCQRLPLPNMKGVSNSRSRSQPEPSLVQRFKEDNSSDRKLPELSRISHSDLEYQLQEAVKGEDLLCDLDEVQVSIGANRVKVIQRKIMNELDNQNSVGDKMIQCVPKRRNLSRWHVEGHPGKEFKMSQRTIIVTTSRKEDTYSHDGSFNNDAHVRYDNTGPENLIKDCQMRMNTPCAVSLMETEKTMFEGGEPTVTEKHFRYPPAGDAALPGNILQSALQQIYAENTYKNKSRISSKDNLLSNTNIHWAHQRNFNLEANNYLLMGFDKADILKNCSQFSSVHSDFDQSENVEIDNLITFKDTNVDKVKSESLYLLRHNHCKSHKHPCLSEARWTPHKGQPDNRMISWTDHRDSQASLLKQSIPGWNQNDCGHPYTFMQETPWAHGCNSLQAIKVQDEPLDLSRKTKQESPPVTRSQSACDDIVWDVVTAVTRDTLTLLQSSPLNLSTK